MNVPNANPTRPDRVRPSLDTQSSLPPYPVLFLDDKSVMSVSDLRVINEAASVSVMENVTMVFPPTFRFVGHLICTGLKRLNLKSSKKHRFKITSLLPSTQEVYTASGRGSITLLSNAHEYGDEVTMDLKVSGPVTETVSKRAHS